MFSRFGFSKLKSAVSTLVVSACLFFQPALLWAAEEEQKKPEWVISYSLVLLCLGLSILILLRPSNRSETSFTQEEIDKRKEDELKKMSKH